jgi:hypothetical protein
MEGHSARLPAHLATTSLHIGRILDQKQLQFARSALWHQTAPLLTADEATTWLEDLGLCLFLPRHAQLLAPAPSLVEAVHGAASTAPPVAALNHANELVARLVDDDRVVPLNLLGIHSEQADYLITPEVLPWVAAIRGDRQWTSAPGGRTSPLVVRAWQVLDREGEATAVQLRELLGREVTEAAVLRALIELWTTVRAMPVYKLEEPARWTLLKNRFPAQLTTAANTAQTTALSALLSIYLRSAVAASAEEAEIFLSPLTARSRIREVIHGMMAARQFGSMSVASQTLLFVAGSLPENLPGEAEAAGVPAIAPPGERPPSRAPRPPFRKEFQDKHGASRRPDAFRRESRPRPPFQKRRPAEPGGAKPWERRPAFRRPDRPADGERPAAASRPGAGENKRSSNEFPRPPRGEKRPGAKPWERRPTFPRPERPAAASASGPRGEKRSSAPFRPAARNEKRTGAKPWQRPPGSPRPDRSDSPSRPGSWTRGEKRPGAGAHKRSEAKPWERRPAFRRPERPGREERPSPAPGAGARREKQPGAKPWQRRPAGAFGERREERRRVDGEGNTKRTGFDAEKRSGQKSGQKPGFRSSGPKKFGPKKTGAKPLGGPRPKFPPRREGAPAGARPGGDRRPSFGKPQRREGPGRPFARGKNFKGVGKKNIRKATPGERNPRKNRSQEETPE